MNLALLLLSQLLSPFLRQINSLLLLYHVVRLYFLSLCIVSVNHFVTHVLKSAIHIKLQVLLDLVCFLCQIQDIIRMSHLLTVFRASDDNHGDVDVAILQALLKGRDLVFTQMLNA